MQLTETKKAIIELIKPYMDKNTDFWCIIYTEYFWWPTYYFQTCYNNRVNNWIFYSWNSQVYNFKILWHYDITSILKYLRKLWIFIWFLDETDEIMLYNNKYDYLEWKNSIWRFPNKPLYLYTDEEDEKLLNLLLKLK